MQDGARTWHCGQRLLSTAFRAQNPGRGCPMKSLTVRGRGFSSFLGNQEVKIDAEDTTLVMEDDVVVVPESLF